MKTRLCVLLLITSTSLCFGMRAPSSSSTNVNDHWMLQCALATENAPLALAIADAMYKKNALEFFKNLSRNKHRGNFYKNIAPSFIARYGNTFLTAAFIAAAQNKNLENVTYLFEQSLNTTKIDQPTLNKAIQATLINYPPTYIYRNDLATYNNMQLILFLEEKGAKISPEGASKALGSLADLNFNFISLNIFNDWGAKNQFNSRCSLSRRTIAKFFISRGGTFEKESFCSDCETSCMAPCAQMDSHRVGKPCTAGSVLGYIVTGLCCPPCTALNIVSCCQDDSLPVCCPCDIALALARSCLPSKEMRIELYTPPATALLPKINAPTNPNAALPTAIPMNEQRPSKPTSTDLCPVILNMEYTDPQAALHKNNCDQALLLYNNSDDF